MRNTPKKIQFLIVEDHLIVAVGLERILIENFKDCEVTVASKASDAIKLNSRIRYDFAILDIRMEDNDSTSLMEKLLRKTPRLRILIFSQNPEHLFALNYIKLGAKGYLSKQSEPSEIIAAINSILKGNTYLSQPLRNIIAENFRKPAKTGNPLIVLSQREKEVMILLIRGYNSTEICHSLHLQPSTVSTYKMKLFRKLGVNNIINLKELAQFHLPELHH